MENQTTNSSLEKSELIRRQLIILLHANQCLRREKTGGDGQPCQLVHCDTMKNVLIHLSNCQDGKNCKQSHCVSSKQIITHWKNCAKQDCQVCLPIKQYLPATNKQNQEQQQQLQLDVKAQVRNDSVQKIVQAILPQSIQNPEQDKKINLIIDYAQRVENDMYKMAKSREEYYQMIEQKISEILKELDERREKRKKDQQALANQQQSNAKLNTFNNQ